MRLSRISVKNENAAQIFPFSQLKKYIYSKDFYSYSTISLNNGRNINLEILGNVLYFLITFVRVFNLQTKPNQTLLPSFEKTLKQKNEKDLLKQERKKHNSSLCYQY